MAHEKDEPSLQESEIAHIRAKIARSKESILAGRVSALDDAFDRVEAKIREKYAPRS